MGLKKAVAWIMQRLRFRGMAFPLLARQADCTLCLIENERKVSRCAQLVAVRERTPLPKLVVPLVSDASGSPVKPISRTGESDGSKPPPSSRASIRFLRSKKMLSDSVPDTVVSPIPSLNPEDGGFVQIAPKELLAARREASPCHGSPDQNHLRRRRSASRPIAPKRAVEGSGTVVKAKPPKPMPPAPESLLPEVTVNESTLTGFSKLTVT